MYYVYLLRSLSCPSQTYIGYTEDMNDRLKTHNSGGSIHTAQYKPWELIAYMGFKNKNQALAFERYLKSGSGRSFAGRRFWQ